ncbi:MAG: Fur family transcriptional regulator [Rhodomicrobium sp.]
MIDMETAPSFPAHDHDHGACMAGALGRAKSRCHEKGIKWTALREQVFRHVTTSHKPVSAYDLIESLAREGKRLAPVSIYRILDVLQEAGIVHRLESRNAFFACMTGHESTPQTVTFVCEGCERVTEVEAPAAYRAIGEVSEAVRFHPRSTIVEVSGTCAECRNSPGAQC